MDYAFASYDITVNFVAGDKDHGRGHLAVRDAQAQRRHVDRASGRHDDDVVEHETGHGYTGFSDFVVGEVLDTTGPTTSALLVTPSNTNAAPTVTANASDLSTGNHNVTAAEYFIDSAGADGTGTTMAATDATFDSPSEKSDGRAHGRVQRSQ